MSKNGSNDDGLNCFGCLLTAALIAVLVFLWTAQSCHAQGLEEPHLSRYGMGSFLSMESPSILGDGAQMLLSYALVQLRSPLDNKAAWRVNVIVTAAVDGQGSGAGVLLDRTVFRREIGPEFALGVGLVYPFTRPQIEGAVEGLGLAAAERNYEVIIAITMRVGSRASR